jgi:hypothetical protein
MKYFVIKFGNSGATNLAVAVATTPSKFKGHRYNASAGSHQLHSSVRRQGEDLTWGWVDQEKPFTAFPQDGVLQELTRDEYLAQAVSRAINSSCGSYIPDGIRGRVVEELEEIEARAARDIKRNAV